MSIVSMQFFFFLIVLVMLYFIVPKKWQWVVILIANVLFYIASGIKYLIYIVFVSFIAYWLALGIEKMNVLSAKTMKAVEDSETKKEVKSGNLYIKRMLCTMAIFLVAGVWIFLKYGNFLISNMNAVFGLLRLNYQQEPISLIVPLGMSFYTFHAIGYVVDIYRGKYHTEKNFAKFFAFVSYFPHIIQGPFSRFESLGKSILEEHEFSYNRLCSGSSRILWGLFQKLIIADKLGVMVNLIFGSYLDYTGSQIFFAMFAYCIQLYADFKGYMDIMCGISHVLGISLAENFRQPYFAKSIDEFWRRWHITLGRWFADYVFYPVSMGKVGQKLGKKARKQWGPKMGKLVPGYFALFFVWTATGLWHGANWTYLVWGYLNLIVILTTMQLTDTYDRWKRNLHINSDGFVWTAFSVLRTFFLVCFFRFFSIGDNLGVALSTIKHAVSDFQLKMILHPGNLFPGMTTINVYVVCFGIVCLFIVDLLQETQKWENIKAKCPMVIRNVWYVTTIIFLVLFAGGSNDLVGGFMYANF